MSLAATEASERDGLLQGSANASAAAGANAPPPLAAAHEAARQRAKRLNFAVVFMLSTMFSSVTPYFSTVAMQQFGFSAAAVGYIFSGFPVGYLAMSMTLSVTGVLTRLSRGVVMRVLRAAVVTCVVAMALFAFAPDATSDRGGRIGMFIAVRLVCGVAVAVVDVCLLVVVVELFPDTVGRVTGEWQALSGLGVLSGPLLGGLLFDYGGGFRTPPLVSSAAVLVSLVLTYVVPLHGLPADTRGGAGAAADDPKSAARQLHALRHLLRLPLVSSVMPWLCFATAMGAYCFYGSLAAAYLTGHYKISAFGCGILMGSVAIVYAACSIGIGRAITQLPVVVRPAIIAVGLLLCAFALFMGGPCFTAAGLDELAIGGFEANRAVAVGFMAFLGVGLSFVAVVSQSSVIDAVRGDSALVSAAGAVTNSFSMTGVIIGPIAGGHITDAYGFPAGLLWVSVAVCVVAVVLVLVFAATLHQLVDAPPSTAVHQPLQDDTAGV
jgi:MFS family permease